MHPKPPATLRLFERIRAELRARDYSPRTEKACLAWERRLVRFHERRHPRELTSVDIKQFLDHLLLSRASAASHLQAVCAIRFLYKYDCSSAPGSG